MGKSDGPKPPPKKFGRRKKKEGETSSGTSSKPLSPKSIIHRLHITKKSGVSNKKKSEEEEETQVVPSKDVEKQLVESTSKEGIGTITEEIDQEVEKIQEESKEDAEVEETLEDKKTQEEDEHTDKTSEDTTTSNETQAAQNGIKRECLYKVLVIGELGTGKTSIIKRYVHQFFSQHYRATIGVDFALKVINWDQNTIIRLQLWDIAGQERFGNMTRVYYKEAVGAFIVFDVTRAATFEAVSKWKQDLDAKVQLADGSPIPCVLLANKCDQQKEGIVNNPNKMNDYCEEHKFTAWYETSAKENINIEEAAKTLVDQIVRNDSSAENGRTGSRDSSKFPLEGADEYVEGKNCSC